jgi:hypothetical protein
MQHICVVQLEGDYICVAARLFAQHATYLPRYDEVMGTTFHKNDPMAAYVLAVL